MVGHSVPNWLSWVELKEPKLEIYLCLFITTVISELRIIYSYLLASIQH